MIDIEKEFQAYVNLALSLSNHYESEQDDNPVSLDTITGPEDIASEALDSMRRDLSDFIEGADDDALAYWQTELGDGQIVGHDFWLTRNGHGAGFWDRFMAEPGAAYGQQLTAMAKPYGSSDLYLGDDGLIYVS